MSRWATGRHLSAQLMIANLSQGSDDFRMIDLNESEQRARSIVESSGGIVRHREDHLMCIEIAADAVWKLCILSLSFLGKTGSRLVYSVDLSAVGVPGFGG